MGEDFVGDPIFQVVVPSKFRGYVLKLAHDGSGHLGVHKTYDRILCNFFWPGMDWPSGIPGNAEWVNAHFWARLS